MTREAARTCLAVYGTLAPGQPNHHQLDGLSGNWRPGTVRGWRHAEAWGAAMGYPGLVLDATGPEVDVQLFRSDDLPDHWTRLDAFEGDGYRRVTVMVQTVGGPVEANVYELAPDAIPRR